MILHSSSGHVSFNDEVHSSTKYDPKSPNGILKKLKPRWQLETELDAILRQCKLNPRAAQSADYLVRFQNKHKKYHKGIIESDSMKYDQEKLPAGEKEFYSYVHPKYLFIRLNCNPQMVEVLLQTHIFPVRMTLEEEMYTLEKHKIHSGLWQKSKSARRLIQMCLQKDTIAESNDEINKSESAL
jgi:hypothetical protein